MADRPIIKGYAAVFDTPANLGKFTEIVRKGAFRETLNENPDIRALWQHDSARVLGRTTAGTLAIDEDQYGLWAEILVPDTATGNEAVKLLERGDVNQMSFRFKSTQDKWGNGGPYGSRVRELLSVELVEVSLVTFPAYQEAVAGLRGGTHAVVGQTSTRSLWATHQRARLDRVAHGDQLHLVRAYERRCLLDGNTPPGDPDTYALRVQLFEADVLDGRKYSLHEYLMGRN